MTINLSQSKFNLKVLSHKVQLEYLANRKVSVSICIMFVLHFITILIT